MFIAFRIFLFIIIFTSSSDAAPKICWITSTPFLRKNIKNMGVFFNSLAGKFNLIHVFMWKKNKGKNIELTHSTTKNKDADKYKTGQFYQSLLALHFKNEYSFLAQIVYIGRWKFVKKRIYSHVTVFVVALCCSSF